jgi:Ribbon-helix-helix protein, copG family
MPQRPRPHRLHVRLSREEHDQLSARAVALGKTRSALIRDALRKATTEETTEDATPPGTVTRTNALAMLAAAAEQGSVTAMVALERALRLEPLAEPLAPVMPGEVKLSDLPPGVLRAVK